MFTVFIHYFEIDHWSDCVEFHFVMYMCPLYFSVSGSEFSALLGLEINVSIFVNIVCRTMILTEVKDVFRSSF